VAGWLPTCWEATGGTVAAAAAVGRCREEESRRKVCG
jgi:hypothetical protein